MVHLWFFLLQSLHLEQKWVVLVPTDRVSVPTPYMRRLYDSLFSWESCVNGKWGGTRPKDVYGKKVNTSCPRTKGLEREGN